MSPGEAVITSGCHTRDGAKETVTDGMDAAVRLVLREHFGGAWLSPEALSGKCTCGRAGTSAIQSPG
ncbi:hypothetical protein GCM10009681_28000 [Luedemannella helvata]|uniref:Uncharacterized protein n=1 Tax=Luedemannella helvata TaxID=349315 RepID=A0ABP4WQ68_9ACTN